MPTLRSGWRVTSAVNDFTVARARFEGGEAGGLVVSAISDVCVVVVELSLLCKALFFAECNAGRSKAAMTAIMEMTTRSSTSVNPIDRFFMSMMNEVGCDLTLAQGWPI